MLARFFKKKPEPKKTVSKKPSQETKKEAVCEEKPALAKKLLTAEGWKRMMLRKGKKG